MMIGLVETVKPITLPKEMNVLNVEYKKVKMLKLLLKKLKIPEILTTTIIIETTITITITIIKIEIKTKTKIKEMEMTGSVLTVTVKISLEELSVSTVKPPEKSMNLMNNNNKIKNIEIPKIIPLINNNLSKKEIGVVKNVKLTTILEELIVSNVKPTNNEKAI
mmetsp:Transcript_452/g.52  ORF Transcript_452/g.52 Transcript_452/m.52 type:complete len:164 (+) Transcript_452:355-846(+)